MVGRDDIHSGTPRFAVDEGGRAHRKPVAVCVDSRHRRGDSEMIMFTKKSELFLNSIVQSCACIYRVHYLSLLARKR